MSATNRRGSNASSVSDEGMLLFGALTLLIVTVALVWTSTHLAAAFLGAPDPPTNPIGLAVGLVTGETSWTTAATIAAIAQLVLVIGLVLGVWLLVRRSRRGGKAPRRVDAANRYMGRGKAIAPLTRKHATETARRLGVDVETAGPGIRMGSTLGGTPLYRSWEDVLVNVAGPRTGKTTSFVVPEIVSAPGAVLATSNKRDVVDATRHVRAAPGPAGHARRVWVFDPQGVVGEDPTWWWNPLSYVVDEVKAAQLAAVFFSAATQPGQHSHAYFTNAGRNLLANLILAAALGGRSLPEVYDWLADPEDDTAVTLLEDHGHDRLAGAVRGVMRSAPEQRAGVYGTAQEVAAFMTNAEAMRWASPPGRSGMAEFRPEEFVETSDTLYSLSREGRGSAGPLVTALTVAVCEAAEDLAKTQPSGRLVTPMVVALDEAANVCRWRDLPDLYSHYGSRAILISTYLQSWSQGVEVWGREGMRKLWSAANVKVYGGGVAETEFLRELSQLIGEYRAPSKSVSHGKSGRSVTTGESRNETVLDVSDLATLERGRAIVFASGTRPVLVRTEPWTAGPHAEQIAASIETSTNLPASPARAVHSASAWSRVTPLSAPHGAGEDPAAHGRTRETR